MNLLPTNIRVLIARAGLLACAALGLWTSPPLLAGTLVLEGQNKGDTNNWYAGNLQNWLELDYIPCRLHLEPGSQGNNQTFTINFEHVNNGNQGIQNLFYFSCSSNVVFTVAPALLDPPSGIWSYTFTIDVLNNQDAFVYFYARLAAGAHLNVGSSLTLSGFPTSMGNLQIHKPAPAVGSPDLVVVKTGPVTAAPGSTIAYSLSYSNKPSAPNYATGVQMNDVLPPQITVLTNSLPPNAVLVGNTIYWDLPNLLPGDTGVLSFQAQVNGNTPFNANFTNTAQILSAQNDLNYADNISAWVTATTSCTSPAVFLNSPGSTNCPGDILTFTATASGTAPLHFQWLKNGARLSGATDSSYTFNPVSIADAGAYAVVVTNNCGSITSAPAALVVNSPVLVVTPPANQSVCPGDTAQFTVSATGTGLAYQWYKGATLLTAQTGSTLTLTNVQSADAGTYTVVVIGMCGLANTNSATLTLNSPVLVVSPPLNQSVCPGDTAQFNVNATGTALQYQWYKNTTLLTGQTGSTLTLTNVQAADAASYTVVVSGMCGLARTNSATLTVNSPVLVVTPPANQSLCPGDISQFNVDATGTALTYQWFKDTTLLTRQTGSTLTLTNVQAADTATYTVIVSGMCGLAKTNSATLTVNSPVLVVTAPANQSVCQGDTARFSINATGTALTYQWYKSTSLLNGQTGSSLIFTNVQPADAATYTVVVSGMCGLAQTNSATLTVNNPVLVVTSPANQSLCPGDTAQFNISATGTALTYQWYKNNALLTGQTAASLTLTNVQAADAATYSVVVSGMCGLPQTNSATLIVNNPVLVVAPPANQSLCPGDTAQFNLNATGTALTYQWYKNTALLAGQTGSTLTLSNVQSADAAIYTVVVSGICGLAQTNNATLTVNSPVLVVTPPANQNVCPGDTAQFSINATGTSLAYQWYKNTVLLAGQTGSTLTLSNVQSADGATYTVLVSGMCGLAQTNNATLTVNNPVLAVTPPTSQSLCPGDTAQFNINATGTALAYQWFKDATLLAAQTGSTLTLTNVQADDGAIYTVVVSGMCGLPKTNSATLTVNNPVLVVTPPGNQSLCPGDTAQFNINATGTALAYQWFKDTTLLTGQTASTLTLTNVQSPDAATYTVVVSGMCGLAKTNRATLTVNSPVLVVSPPVNQNVCPGDTALFNINATGTALAYQWFKETTLLTGQTGSILTLTNVQSPDAATYTVVVSGMCGLARTNSATLTVNSPVLVVTSPANQSLCPGDTALFNINATGTALAYQWFKETTLLTGQTGNTLTLTNVQATDAATYTVVVSGMCGLAKTNTATLTVNNPVLVVTPPANQSLCPGDTALFNINATGTALAYQWFKNTTLLTGQTGSTLTLTNVQSADVATYTVAVSGMCGLAQTNSATLTVNSPVLVVAAPANQSVCPGDNAQFSLNATGTALTYQWFKNAALLTGQTGSTLTLTNVQSADAATYTVVLSGMCGVAQTNSATLMVYTATAATPLPNALKNLGDSITFSTIASGTGPFTYLWTKNGSPISGATLSSLTLTNLGYADGALYTVQVSGHCNTATQSATLTINHPPTVTILSPTNGAVFIAPANFTVLANAQDIDGTVTNVVFFLSGTNNLGNSTNAPYFVELTNVPAGTYTYTAKAWDNLGATGVSAPVTITVRPYAPLTIVSAMQFDPQTGLFEQTVRVTNPTYSTYNAVRIYVGNLTNNAVLWNASGTTNGVPYVESYTAVAPGTYVDFVLEYYVPSRIQPYPTLTPVLVPPPQGGGVSVSGFQQHINRELMLPNKTLLLEFSTLTNRLYYIQYTSDQRLWNTAIPAVTGNGTKIQWIDDGLPKTISPPSTTPERFYRVILLP